MKKGQEKGEAILFVKKKGEILSSVEKADPLEQGKRATGARKKTYDFQAYWGENLIQASLRRGVSSL